MEGGRFYAVLAQGGADRVAGFSRPSLTAAAVDRDGVALTGESVSNRGPNAAATASDQGYTLGG